MVRVSIFEEFLFVVVVYELVTMVCTCTYVVESRHVSERAVDLRNQYMQGGPCDIARRMKDRWSLVGNGNLEKAKMRIRGNYMIVKYRTTKLRYRCMENRGNTFLLGTFGYLGNRQGVLCLGFAQMMNHSTGEYTVTRLNGHGPERHILSPQIIPDGRISFPTFNETCILEGSDIDEYAYLRRTERRCTFPLELQQTWNYTYHNARHVTFSKKTFILDLFSGGIFRFDCSVKDGDLYAFRSMSFSDLPDLDGIMCMNITRLTEDPHYLYEMSRLNSGEELDGQVKLFPSGQTISLYEDCDWLESPARPEYLY